MSTSLRTTFRALCQDCFPRWRNSTSWTIMEGPHGKWVDAQGDTHTTREHGSFDSTTMTIYINDGWSTSQACRRIIVHENCHAVTRGGHGTRFCARLRQAAQRASDLGDRTLSAQLLEEADGYEHTACALGSPYTRIPDVLVDNPEATFEQVLTYLAQEYLETAPAFVARYPRLRAVYDRTRRQEIATVCRQRKTVRDLGMRADLLTDLAERLRLLEAVQNEDRQETP